MLQPLHTIRRVHRHIAKNFQEYMIAKHGSIEAAILSEEMSNLRINE
jgi:hypothetical protein